MSAIRIGVSGWRYAGWRGVFYPEGLPQRAELSYLGRRLASLELNGSFYSLQRPESYRAWYHDTPPGFCFAVKGGRFVTHMKKLRDAETPLANFFASGVLCLEDKLGPFLWQLPPNLRFDPERLDTFLRLLPRTTEEAAALALGHRHPRMLDRTDVGSGAARPLRHAMEVRHESFRDRRFVTLLRRHGVALAVADTAGIFPYLEDVTADFVYVRLHGAEVLYTSGYGPDALDAWARRVRIWAAGSEPADRAVVDPAPAPPSSGRDVYVYFDNDAKVHAPFDALSLADRLGLRASDPQGARGRP